MAPPSPEPSAGALGAAPPRAWFWSKVQLVSRRLAAPPVATAPPRPLKAIDPEVSAPIAVLRAKVQRVNLRVPPALAKTAPPQASAELPPDASSRNMLSLAVMLPVFWMKMAPPRRGAWLFCIVT